MGDGNLKIGARHFGIYEILDVGGTSRERVIFYPACGKFIGSYLTDFVGEEDKTDE